MNYILRNNETGKERVFEKLDDALTVQEYLCIICGVDCEVL
jgi:hypothetical protein